VLASSAPESSPESKLSEEGVERISAGAGGQRTPYINNSESVQTFLKEVSFSGPGLQSISTSISLFSGGEVAQAILANSNNLR